MLTLVLIVLMHQLGALSTPVLPIRFSGGTGESGVTCMDSEPGGAIIIGGYSHINND